MEGANKFEGSWLTEGSFAGNNTDVTLLLHNYNYVRITLRKSGGSFQALTTGKMVLLTVIYQLSVII